MIFLLTIDYNLVFGELVVTKKKFYFNLTLIIFPSCYYSVNLTQFILILSQNL